MKNKITLILMILIFVSNASFANENGIIKRSYNGLKENISDTWNNYTNVDIYLPLHTWHNRFMYDQEKTDEYNEDPYGVGIGISKYDEHNNWNGIYILEFQDSNNRIEPMLGYGWEKQYYLDNGIRLGLGYTVLVTLRDDWMKYKLPVPGILPLASISYKDLTIQNTYIPGTYNNGNVWFVWARYKI